MLALVVFRFLTISFRMATETTFPPNGDTKNVGMAGTFFGTVAHGHSFCFVVLTMYYRLYQAVTMITANKLSDSRRRAVDIALRVAIVLLLAANLFVVYGMLISTYVAGVSPAGQTQQYRDFTKSLLGILFGLSCGLIGVVVLMLVVVAVVMSRVLLLAATYNQPELESSSGIVRLFKVFTVRLNHEGNTWRYRAAVVRILFLDTFVGALFCTHWIFAGIATLLAQSQLPVTVTLFQDFAIIPELWIVVIYSVTHSILQDYFLSRFTFLRRALGGWMIDASTGSTKTGNKGSVAASTTATAAHHNKESAVELESTLSGASTPNTPV